MLPAATTTTVMVGAGLKISAIKKGVYLGGWPHRRLLTYAKKCPESGSGGEKQPRRMALPVATTAVPVPELGLGL